MRQPPKRFLTHGQGNGHGYRSQPARQFPQVADEPDIRDRIREATSLSDEPEAIGPAIVDAYKELAKTYDAIRYKAEVEQQQQARRLLTAEDRLLDVQRRAKQRHIDVSREVHVINQMLERAKKGGRGEPPAAVRRIERVEHKLDHRPDLAA